MRWSRLLRKLDTRGKRIALAVMTGVPILLTWLRVRNVLDDISLGKGWFTAHFVVDGVMLVLLWAAPIYCLVGMPYPPGRCLECGYSLRGLREQRCPECGRPFTFKEIGSTPEKLDFAGKPTEDGSD